MKAKEIKNNSVIYQAKNGAIELRGDFSRETIWATQAQIANAFDVDVRTINEHIKNIYRTGELPEKATIRNFRIVQKEGDREIEREIKHYDLDLILSVGYRVNSQKATSFRQWATKTLRNYIVDGFALNKNRIAKNHAQFLEAIENIKQLLPAGTPIDHASVLELISAFADTWFSLDAYDKDELTTKGATKKAVAVTAEELAGALLEFKSRLMKRTRRRSCLARSAMPEMSPVSLAT